MNNKNLSERDICSKFVGPAIKRAGWDGMMEIREEVNFTRGRIIVRGKHVTRGKSLCQEAANGSCRTEELHSLLSLLSARALSTIESNHYLRRNSQVE
jgi:hypothetical protein